MKRVLVLGGLLFGASLALGCSPGLSHHGAYAKSANDQAPPTAKEASPEAVGTTTVTNATLPTLTAKIIKHTPPPILPYVNFDDRSDEFGADDEDRAEGAEGAEASLAPENNNVQLQTWGQQPKPLSIEEKYGF